MADCGIEGSEGEAFDLIGERVDTVAEFLYLDIEGDDLSVVEDEVFHGGASQLGNTTDALGGTGCAEVGVLFGGYPEAHHFGSAIGWSHPV